MHQLELTQDFNAPVSRLFAAWSKPELMRTWFAPGDLVVLEADVDFRVGGSYRLVMQEPGGERHVVGGEYLEIAPEEKLAFSWKFETSPHTTRVALEFTPLGEQQSRLQLRHTEFVDAASCEHHKQGWLGCLANLAGKGLQ